MTLKIVKKLLSYYEFLIPITIGVMLIPVAQKMNGLTFVNIIYLVTFLALLWYSLETRELKIATQKQLEPILFLYLGQSTEYLELSNIGKTPVSNIFIRPVLIGNYKFEFNLFKPISHIIPGEKYKIEITKSFNLTRVFSQSVKSLITAMQEANIKKIELILEYDTSFQTDKKTKFVFEIHGLLPDEKDPIRECKIYLLPR